MSKVATYVEGADGRYYMDPVIYTNDWYVRFDDDQPPQIVVRSFKNSTQESEAKRCKKFLKSAGFKFKNFDYESGGLRMFPPAWTMKQAGWSNFIMLAPFPVDGVQIHSDGDFEIMPDIMQGTVMIWNRDFLVEQILDLWVANAELSETVLAYLGGTRQKCRNTVKKQYPQFPESHEGEELMKLRVRD